MRPATPTPHTSQVRRHDRPRQISAGPRRPGRPLAAAALAAAALALLGPLLGHAVAKAQEQHPRVLVSRIDGPITPVVADHLPDGRQVQLGPYRTVTLRTAQADVVEHGMGALRSLVQRLADPNLAFLLLSIGTLALIYELASPGMGLGGVLGTIMLVLGFVALSVLPVNLAGLLLLGLAAALFVGEVLIPGVGVFAAGGAIALAAAGLLLFEG